MIPNHPLLVHVDPHFHTRQRITLNYCERFLKTTPRHVSAFPAETMKDDCMDGMKFVVIFVRDSKTTGSSKRWNMIDYGHVVFQNWIMAHWTNSQQQANVPAK